MQNVQSRMSYQQESWYAPVIPDTLERVMNTVKKLVSASRYPLYLTNFSS